MDTLVETDISKLVTEIERNLILVISFKSASVSKIQQQMRYLITKAKTEKFESGF